MAIVSLLAFSVCHVRLWIQEEKYKCIWSCFWHHHSNHVNCSVASLYGDFGCILLQQLQSYKVPTKCENENRERF